MSSFSKLYAKLHCISCQTGCYLINMMHWNLQSFPSLSVRGFSTSFRWPNLNFKSCNICDSGRTKNNDHGGRNTCTGEFSCEVSLFSNTCMHVIFIGIFVLLMLTGCTMQHPNTSKGKRKIGGKNVSCSNRVLVAEFPVMCDTLYRWPQSYGRRNMMWIMLDD